MTITFTRADTTITFTANRGDVLVATLPDSLGSDAVSTYEGIRVPADGWLVGMSWFWRTESVPVGNYEFSFRAIINESRSVTVFARVLVNDDG